MKKALILAIMTTILLVSCQRETPGETAIPEEIPAGPICTESASFVADVTIPDNTNLDPGKPFTKTWRIKNTGTCTWDENYNLVFALNEPMGAPDSVPIEKTRPGREVEISVDLTTPTENGEYRADFQLLNPEGVPIPIDNGQYLWVVIAIGNAPGWADAGTESVDTWADGPGLAEATCAFTTDEAKNAEILAAINAYRAEQELPGLIANPQLGQAAQSHANDMACNELFVHIGSNGSSPGTRVFATGYDATSVGENVYGSYLPLSGLDLVAWWATDQSNVIHNENLLNPEFTEAGIGYSFFGRSGYYVAVFATK